jgi:hypothetical protein
MSCIVALLFCIALASAADAQSIGSPAWVTATISTLNSGSPSEQQVARKQLIQAVEMKGAPSGYPATFAAAILPVLQGGNARAKLNAAIALERIANKTASPSLLPAIEALLDDRCDAIALWGIKSARPLIAAGGAPASALAGKVAATVKAHLGCGSIAEEAYAALLQDSIQPADVDPLLATLQARTAAYGMGAPPPSPLAEQSVPAYLAAGCWSHATPDGRVRILTAVAKFTCATAGAIGDGSRDRSILQMARISAEALEVIGTQMGNDPLVAAAHELKRIELEDGAAIPADCKTLTSVLHELGIDLQPPRQIKPVSN